MYLDIQHTELLLIFDLGSLWKPIVQSCLAASPPARSSNVSPITNPPPPWDPEFGLVSTDVNPAYKEKWFATPPRAEDDEVLDPSAADADMVYPPPFGFHPNLLTSMLGFSTLVLLWIPIPFLHWSGAELFKLPPNFATFISIVGIALSGVVFNAGFMVCP